MKSRKIFREQLANLLVDTSCEIMGELYVSILNPLLGLSESQEVLEAMSSSLVSLQSEVYSGDYKFDASAGVLSFDGCRVKEILLVINLSAGKVLYNPIGEESGVLETPHSIKLTIGTSDMEDTDELLVYKTRGNESFELIFASMQGILDKLDQSIALAKELAE